MTLPLPSDIELSSTPEKNALRINTQIATEMKVRPQQIAVAIALMD